MKMLRTIPAARRYTARLRRRGRTLALVPTMGALHEGHLSLIRRARREADAVTVSLFVNPLQFASPRAAAGYPRSFAEDLRLCRREGVDAVFAPAVREMYPRSPLTSVHVDRLTVHLCGPHRPGHFDAVARVVLKLFHICEPDFAYFGAKDFQQARMITRMAGDLNLRVAIRVCPTIRAPDGVALSSRLRLLDEGGRRRARAFPAALHRARQLLKSGAPADRIAREMRAALRAQGVRVDYTGLYDPDTLWPLSRTSYDLRGHVPGFVGRRGGLPAARKEKVLAAVAGWIGRVRVIDNQLLSYP